MFDCSYNGCQGWRNQVSLGGYFFQEGFGNFLTFVFTQVLFIWNMQVWQICRRGMLVRCKAAVEEDFFASAIQVGNACIGCFNSDPLVLHALSFRSWLATSRIRWTSRRSRSAAACVRMCCPSQTTNKPCVKMDTCGSGTHKILEQL